MSRIHDRTKVWPLVYVQASAINQIPQTVWDKCGLWVAQYANSLPTGYQSNPWNAGRYGEAMRQYTSTGRLPGYSGNLDLNVFYGERWQWDAYAQGDGAKTPSTVLPETTTGVQSNNNSSCGSDCRVIQSGQYVSMFWPDWWNVSVPSGNPSIVYPGDTVCHNGSTQASSNTGRTYVVQSGDYLYSIAQRLGISWTQLTGYKSGNPSLIYPGEVLYY